MTATSYRNRHPRGSDHHYGELPATLVSVSSAIDGLTETGDIEAALGELETRLLALEERGTYLGHFSIDADIST